MRSRKNRKQREAEDEKVHLIADTERMCFMQVYAIQCRTEHIT